MKSGCVDSSQRLQTGLSDFRFFISTKIHEDGGSMYIRNVATKKSARCHNHEERNINFRHCENVNSCKWVNKIRSSDEFWNTLYRTWSIKTKKKRVYFASSYVYHACRSPTWGHAVVQLVEALRCKPRGRDSQ